MNKQIVNYIGGFLLASSLITTSAAVVILEFQTDGAQGSVFDFDSNEGTFNADNASLFFESYIGGVKGDSSDNLNATTTGFGINESGGGDDTNELDNDNGDETVRITFTPTGLSSSINLISFDIGSFGGSETGTWAINGGGTTPITGGINLVGLDVTGLFLEVTGTSLDAFSFDGLTFDDGVVPEPASLALIASGVLFLCQFRKRKMRG